METKMAGQLQFEQFMCGDDNFGVLIHDTETGKTASIDAPKTAPILAALSRRGWTLTDILTTHKHGDHVEGNLPLKSQFNCHITGPEGEKADIPGIDTTVRGGDSFDWAGHRIDVIATPGHTAGHIVYHLPDDGVLFAGDTLFALGCGRLFERGPDEMFVGLSAIRNLPDDTVIYCGHEYTAANARFALAVDPDNKALQARAEEIAATLAAGKPTLPTTLRAEKQTNPFLRWDDAGLRASLGMDKASDAEIFAEVRKRKDNF
jgi:hydroxyacylglutathione hydrolase